MEASATLTDIWEKHPGTLTGQSSNFVLFSKTGGTHLNALEEKPFSAISALVRSPEQCYRICIIGEPNSINF